MSANKVLLLDQELAKNLSDGVSITFESMLGLSPHSKSFEIGSMAEASGDITGIVSLSQDDLDAVCLISFPAKTIFYILKKIYGVEFTSIEDGSVKQGVGELANIINGVVKTKINEKGFKFRMGLPNVVMGRAHTVMTEEANSSIALPFEVENLQFSVTLTVTKSKLSEEKRAA